MFFFKLNYSCQWSIYRKLSLLLFLFFVFQVKDWYSTNALDSRRRKFEFPLMIWVDQWGAGKYLARLWEVRGRRVVVIFK